MIYVVGKKMVIINFFQFEYFFTNLNSLENQLKTNIHVTTNKTIILYNLRTQEFDFRCIFVQIIWKAEFITVN